MTNKVSVFVYQNNKKKQSFSFDIEDGKATFKSQGIEFDEGAKIFCESVIDYMEKSKLRILEIVNDK